MLINIRERSQKIAACIKTKAGQSVRALAVATGLPKSSAGRHRQGIERRTQASGCDWWEQPVGFRWMLRFVVGVVYYFGIKHGIGAESLSEFFHSVGLHPHVASSPSTLRHLKHQLQQAILDYEQVQAPNCQPQSGQGICLGGDETFFGKPVLVMLELASGFLFVETEQDNRTYETWVEALEQSWANSGWRCHYFVSDGARALLKLGTQALGCVSIPDVFHALRALVRPLGKVLGRQVAEARKQQAHLELQQLANPDASGFSPLTAQLEAVATQLEVLESAQTDYHQALEAVTRAIHPFVDGTPQPQQTLQALTTHLAKPLTVLQELAQVYGSADATKAIDTFRAQIAGFAQGLEAWWKWVRLDLQAKTTDLARQTWVCSTLLPYCYWWQQAEKTRQPVLKRQYLQACQACCEALVAHPMTHTCSPADLEAWKQWATDFCTKYQRTSSAVEGRNGYLARCHFNARGFSPQSLKALTIIHNFDLKRADGTTAAQRLFGKSFPDLFEFILSQINDLPRPRESAQAKKLKSPHGETVPA